MNHIVKIAINLVVSAACLLIGRAYPDSVLGMVFSGLGIGYALFVILGIGRLRRDLERDRDARDMELYGESRRLYPDKEE